MHVFSKYIERLLVFFPWKILSRNIGLKVAIYACSSCNAFSYILMQPNHGSQHSIQSIFYLNISKAGCVHMHNEWS